MTATDRAIDAVEKAIDKLRAKKPTEANRYRLHNMELRRASLQKKQFDALQRRMQRRLRKGAG